MISPSHIAARALVWVAALLIPAEAMPMSACGCASGIPGAAAEVHKPSCCGKGVGNCCCCRGKARSGQACCCCHHGKSGLNSGCQCAKTPSAPLPVPGSNNTQTEMAKTLASAHAALAIDAVSVSGFRPRAVHRFSLPGETSLERLSSLCRLVV